MQLANHFLECSRSWRPFRRGGFSVAEILAVVVVGTILMVMVIAISSHTRARTRSANCLSQLRGVWTGLRQYSMDHSHFLPDPGASEVPWEQSLSPYIPDRKLYKCPGDAEVFQSTGSSYDWRDTGDEATTLAGKRFTDIRRQSAVLVFDALPGWHAVDTMNIVAVDGSAHTMFHKLCLSDLLTPAMSTTAGNGSDLMAAPPP